MEHSTEQQQNTYSSQGHMQHLPRHYILDHKISVNKYEVIQSMFSEHNGIKLKINNRKTSKKKNLKQITLGSKKKPTDKLDNFFELNENEIITC